MSEQTGGFMSGLSAFMENAAGPIGIGLSLASGIFGAVSANKQAKRARRKARKHKQKMKAAEEAYMNMDTRNPYLNMENTMEDLTVNQQQADFQREQFQQSQANILGNLKGAAGGSGVAALAQQLAQSGQLASQQASASIGQQEAANQRAAAAQAGQIQNLERQGDIMSREQERQKMGTMLGMEQQRYAAYQEQVGQAQQAKMAAIAGGITGAADMFAGFGDQTDYKALYENLKEDN
jgi:hypothetical protein